LIESFRSQRPAEKSSKEKNGVAGSPDLRKSFRQAAVMSGTVTASLLIYLGIFEVLKSTRAASGGIVPIAQRQMLRYGLYAAAVVAVILIRWLSRTLVKGPPGEPSSMFIQRLVRASIMVSMLSEIPAILGFVNFLLTGSSWDFYFLLFVSLFLEFMYFPRLRVWEEAVRDKFPTERFSGGEND
jgi:hypothetical protein